MEDVTSSLKGKSSYIPILVISIGAIISTSVTLSLIHILCIKYCKRRRDQDVQTLYIEPSTIGLDKRILNTIPILFYSSKTRELYRISQGDQCVICLGQLSKGDSVRWLPNCGHAFHVSCIDNWFHAHTNCPICRSLVVGVNPYMSSHNVATLHGNRADISGASGCARGRSRGHKRARSGGLLCHSTKMVLPIEGLGPRDLIKVGLNRSLSMDHCCVVVDTREHTSSSFSSSFLSNSYPPLSKIDFALSRLYRAQSIRRLDLMSSMAMRSLHGLWGGQGGTSRNNGILPY